MLRPDQRRKIRELCNTCDMFEKAADEFKRKLIADAVSVGDTVYQTDGIMIFESTVRNIIYDTDGIAFDGRAVGKTVFLTREEAKIALAERVKHEK